MEKQQTNITMKTHYNLFLSQTNRGINNNNNNNSSIECLLLMKKSSNNRKILINNISRHLVQPKRKTCRKCSRGVNRLLNPRRNHRRRICLQLLQQPTNLIVRRREFVVTPSHQLWRRHSNGNLRSNECIQTPRKSRPSSNLGSNS